MKPSPTPHMGSISGENSAASKTLLVKFGFTKLSRSVEKAYNGFTGVFFSNAVVLQYLPFVVSLICLKHSIPLDTEN